MLLPARQGRIAALLLALSLAVGCSGSPAASAAPGWWRNRVAYEVFVRSFADSDGDGVGDLRGLTAHLDYLNDGVPGSTGDLGVGAVWLMPIFPSPSYHGYDVTDYRAVNPQYGTLDDFDAFVLEAHRRGIRVILDMVLNHSSSAHPWFQDSQQGPAAAKRSWYSWRDALPTSGWRRPWDGTLAWYALNGSYYYGLFSPSMPDLYLGEPAVEAELVDSMKFWLGRGVDGFRLDAVRHYFESADGVVVDQPESHAFLRRIRSALERDYPATLLVAEAWAPLEIATTYRGSGDEAEMGFAFDLADALVAAASSGDASGVINVLARTEAALPDRSFDAPFLSNHDQVRVLRALGGDAAAARVAAAALMAMPGTPFVYYGEEIGMQGGAGTDDRNKRTPFRWNATAPGYGFTSGAAWFSAAEAPGVDLASAQADPLSLWNAYRRLIALRQGRPALATGDATRPAVTGGGAGAFALLRSAGGERVLFVANFAGVPTGPFSVAAGGSPTPLWAEGMSGPPTAGAGAVAFPGLDARAYAFVLLE